MSTPPEQSRGRRLLPSVRYLQQVAALLPYTALFRSIRSLRDGDIGACPAEDVVAARRPHLEESAITRRSRRDQAGPIGRVGGIRARLRKNGLARQLDRLHVGLAGVGDRVLAGVADGE